MTARLDTLSNCINQAYQNYQTNVQTLEAESEDVHAETERLVAQARANVEESVSLAMDARVGLNGNGEGRQHGEDELNAIAEELYMQHLQGELEHQRNEYIEAWQINRRNALPGTSSFRLPPAVSGIDVDSRSGESVLIASPHSNPFRRQAAEDARRASYMSQRELVATPERRARMHAHAPGAMSPRTLSRSRPQRRADRSAIVTRDDVDMRR